MIDEIYRRIEELEVAREKATDIGERDALRESILKLVEDFIDIYRVGDENEAKERQGNLNQGVKDTIVGA